MRPPWLSRALLLWALVLATLWIGGPYVRAFLFAAGEPSAVAPRGELADFERVTTDIFRERSPAVALIVTRVATRDALGRTAEGGGTGSGFVWDAAGHIVTNNHVVEGAQEVRVRLGTERTFRASVVGTAPDYDLAV